MKLVHSLSLVILWHCSANIIPRLDLEASITSTLYATDGIPQCYGSLCPRNRLYKRASRSKCSAQKRPKTQRRTDLKADLSINNATIWPRMHLPKPDELEEFIVEGAGNDGDAEMVVFGTGPHEDEDVCTAIYDDFTREFSFAASDLKGCTMLAVISRKGVYMGHYWESLVFAPDESELGEWDTGVRETEEELFQRIVLDGLVKGAKGDDKEELQASFTQFARSLGDEHVRAYLIRPRKSFQNAEDEEKGIDIGPPETQGYPKQWQRMKDTVVKILPKVGEPGRWSEVIYDATDDPAELDTSRGKVLFKFDPIHIKKASRTGKDTRLAMMWVETREIHRDQWQD